jgi:phosphate transporter
LLALMMTALGLSCVVTNHTSPVLCLSIISPVIKDFDDPSSPYRRALLLGVAHAANIGGMISPIASLQSALAVSSLQAAHHEVYFLDWLKVAVPLCLILTVAAWAILLVLYRPDDVQHVPPILCDREQLGKRDWVVVAVSVATMIGWAGLQWWEGVVGDAGIISLVSMSFLFGTGILTQVSQ